MVFIINLRSINLSNEYSHEAETCEIRESRNRCRGFLEHLIDVILSHHTISAEVVRAIYCFSPELLVEGDDEHVFDSFSELVRLLGKSGSLSSVESEAAVEEFVTMFVDVPARD